MKNKCICEKHFVRWDCPIHGREIDVKEYAIKEMLEPNEGFPSRLEWLADWLDKTDKELRRLSDNPEITDYLWGTSDEVQQDLRRWANQLRSNQ